MLRCKVEMMELCAYVYTPYYIDIYYELNTSSNKFCIKGQCLQHKKIKKKKKVLF